MALVEKMVEKRKQDEAGYYSCNGFLDFHFRLPKLNMRVRFPLPAPSKKALKVLIFQCFQGFLFVHTRRPICLKTPVFAYPGGAKGGVTKVLPSGDKEQFVICISIQITHHVKNQWQLLQKPGYRTGGHCLRRRLFIIVYIPGAFYLIIQSLNSFSQETRNLRTQGAGILYDAARLGKDVPH